MLINKAEFRPGDRVVFNANGVPIDVVIKGVEVVGLLKPNKRFPGSKHNRVKYEVVGVDSDFHVTAFGEWIEESEFYIN